MLMAKHTHIENSKSQKEVILFSSTLTLLFCIFFNQSINQSIN